VSKFSVADDALADRKHQMVYLKGNCELVLLLQIHNADRKHQMVYLKGNCEQVLLITIHL
jgi:hypothetical protein